jgi:uncharacterized Zn-finger protein
MTSSVLPAAGQPLFDIVEAPERRVSCEGIGRTFGHPRIYLEMGAASYIKCPYCSRLFVLGSHIHTENEELDPGAYTGEDSH